MALRIPHYISDLYPVESRTVIGIVIQNPDTQLLEVVDASSILQASNMAYLDEIDGLWYQLVLSGGVLERVQVDAPTLIFGGGLFGLLTGL